MDFFRVGVKEQKDEPSALYPDFIVGRSQDLMVRGRSFYAIYDEKKGLWSTDEYDVQRLIDEYLDEYAQRLQERTGEQYTIKYLRTFGNNGWTQFRKFVSNISDNSHQLDTHLTFANDEVKKSDYVSRKLPYPLQSGDCSAWDELVGTLYSVEERAKIEWAIGAVVSGDSKYIQKFLVLYGPAGTGKSTILNVIQKLFDGYTTTFEAKALGSNTGSFATEVFKNNPLVAIQHDGDLSKIEDNTRLNSIISHEEMTMNEKYKASYTARVNAFLFMGTNQPVRISDAKSGIIRRLIDVHPTGVIIPTNHYHTLMSKIDFELGAIAYHCLQVYREMGKNYYNNYRPLEMMLQTDITFNFIEAHFDIFKAQDSTSLKQAYTLYKEWCSDTGVQHVMPQYKFREELRNYFDEFRDRGELDGQQVRSLYSGFNASKFKEPAKDANAFSLVIEETESIFDEMAADWPAQYEIWDDEIEQYRPKNRWANVRTTLRDIDTGETHYVRVPENHIIIDFDLRDEKGNKSLELNLQAASNWPATYAELSKSGEGVHLHYDYDGDVTELSNVYSEGIEIKTLLGDAALRRKLSKCNNIQVSTMSVGPLPLKEKKVISEQTIKSERGLREMIRRNLAKEIHPSTKSSIDFIKHILDEAYESGMAYDVNDLKPVIFAFANQSTNQSMYCLKVAQTMKFHSENGGDSEELPPEEITEKRLVHFDVEVYPNLFVICWKFDGDADMVKMINPSAADVEALLKMLLVGFNNRRYDNHILYGAFMGYNNEQLYQLSQRIINNDRNALFAGAYGLSYADIYDFMSEKMSLKMMQILLGLRHKELDIPWDQPVPEDRWEEIVDYCCNDVLSQEAAFHAREADFKARQILAEISGLTVNDTTAKHTARIIFGEDKDYKESFQYTDLSEDFPGYKYDMGKSTYRDEDPSEGGYVYAEPGMYDNVALLDVASMHPTSIIKLNLFGEYTPRFKDLMDARLAIKRGDLDTAGEMLNGKLKPFLEGDLNGLSYALKIVINTVYGLTSAKFENPFRDNRNIDNIVAKRGALFMIDLKHFVQERGFTVAHIKTDSIKIPNATREIIDDVFKFGEKYGYTFEHEATYDKFCLVNDAVYIARMEQDEGAKWIAVGAQFQHPYVYKTLFTGEEILFDDYCETKQVQQGTMYLDFDYDRPLILPTERLKFVGKVGRFVPVTEKSGGGILYRIKDDKFYKVSGTSGHFWMEAETYKNLGEEVEIDLEYYDKLVEDAVAKINQFGSIDEFVNHGAF